jgi:hypothetical protein
MGVREVLIYRRDYRCGHHTEANRLGRSRPTVGHRAEVLLHQMRQRGGEIRPKFPQARMGTG